MVALTQLNSKLTRKNPEIMTLHEQHNISQKQPATVSKITRGLAPANRPEAMAYPVLSMLSVLSKIYFCALATFPGPEPFIKTAF